ncbi:response regulator [Thermomonas flagellata]|uniref:response regulator n=1 Tax=Thermomonas flagellata TaxID=2888524 RepID=UPI001F047C21|nr:response regulator [Thermomonas flagellata]
MHTELPQLLVAEDDPVSAAFLCDGARRLPAAVHCADSIATALRLARAQRFDLLLLDANLPDGRGEALLQRLRSGGVEAPAIAHTAAVDPAVASRLLAAGFEEVLAKPLPLASLLDALRRHLPGVAAADWDDAAAQAALGGQAGHVQALRGLFLQELPGQRARIRGAHARGDLAALRAELHRLAASCGFVGAPRLAAAVRGLQQAPADPARLQRLEEAVAALLG